MNASTTQQQKRSSVSLATEPVELLVRLEAAAMYAGIQFACERIVSMDDSGVTVSNRETSFVLDGRTYSLAAYDGDYKFWVGLNGPRLFFIAYMKAINVEKAREAFAFCFGGAEKAGWEMNYEPMTDGGMSVWATCMTDRTLPLSRSISDINGAATAAMTPEGIYWATDIAMMVQSWVRTCQRHGFSCHDKLPAPL